MSIIVGASLVAQTVKSLPAVQETRPSFPFLRKKFQAKSNDFFMIIQIRVYEYIYSRVFCIAGRFFTV